VLERGAVEGLVFHRGAVAALAPEEPQVDGRLVTLVRKDLVRPEQPVFPNDDAYRFRHLLIRDTAYEALPKAARAELHDRFALWLEEHGAGLVELDEIVGYHLEQAYRYRVELGPLDERAEKLATRAAERLLRSGERAGARGDDPAAKVLLQRAIEILPEDAPLRREAQVACAHVLAELGDFAESAALRAEAAAAARAAGDERVLARLALIDAETAIQSDPDALMTETLAEAERAHATLERVGDDYGAVWALRVIGCFQAWLGRSGEAKRTWTGALERARIANARAYAEILGWLLWEAWWGPDPAEQGLARCNEYLEQLQAIGSKRFEGIAYDIRGVLHSYLGRVEEARADIATGRGILGDVGNIIWWAGASMLEADLEFAAGDPQRAYDALVTGREALEERAETGYLATVLGMQSQAAMLLGRDDEALELADETERLAQRDDFEPISRIALVRAQVMARRGDFGRADELLSEGTRLIEATDYVFLHIDLHFARAEVYRLAGRLEDERKELELALATSERKGSVAAAEQARARLD
jgi:tetratricopeptide (TPR) repeat protein